ncbi:MAG: UDP-N-acetylglucosamine 2-epimerase (non-hydrolyzing) [Candidatus Paceibacterota bacterium]|jgi:UDP-N-acetylglucosamine 2-epimerase (non-hydrolysing)
MKIKARHKHDAMKIICVVGARPNFIKIAPIIEEINNSSRNSGRRRNITCKIVHTGQHYDYKMSGAIFKELEIPKPDYNLGIGSGSHGLQTGKIMIEFEKVCLKEDPDLVLVVGDVNSTLAASLVAAKMNIKVGHIEAGLRSFDRNMPEEINRVLTDQIADYLFVTEPSAIKNLLNEGISRKKIFYVGNVMIDTLLKHKSSIKDQNSQILKKFGLRPREYALLTLHRPSNVDDEEKIKKLFSVFERISQIIPIIFPAHPRTIDQIRRSGLKIKTNNLIITEPLGYLDNLNLIANSKFVMTDSGGIQEETTVLGIPCLTLRTNTERPVTIDVGTNILVGRNSGKITREVKNILAGRAKKNKIPKYWDGKTARRIIAIINKHY